MHAPLLSANGSNGLPPHGRETNANYNPGEGGSQAPPSQQAPQTQQAQQAQQPQQPQQAQQTQQTQQAQKTHHIQESKQSQHAQQPQRAHLGPSDLAQLAQDIKRWGRELGFQRLGIAGIDLREDEARLLAWLAQGRQGDMTYMARHGARRGQPAELVPGTLSVVSVGMDYLPEPQARSHHRLADPAAAFISRYALGRDYHKLLRQRLQRLADRVSARIGPFGYRAFVDSAPVLEKALAQRAGLGWIGKHTNLIDPRAGSWFFLGELFVDLPLPPDTPASNHCGRCQACLAACPTGAILAPYELDARLCISYLTIELQGPIPEPLRPLIGNRVYGCDDCQLVCPWNRFARLTAEGDFHPRQGLDSATLLDLFAWDETEFLRRTEGSAIRRLGHTRWLRNLAVALGNAPPTAAIHQALAAQIDHPSELVREHVTWALRQQGVCQGRP